MNNKEKVLEKLIKYFAFIKDKFCIEAGNKLGESETIDGISFDVSFPLLLQRIELSEGEKFAITYHYQGFITRHRIKSGIGEHRLKKLQKKNREQLINYQ